MPINKFQLAAAPKVVGDYTYKMLKDLGEFQNFGGSGRFKKLGASLLAHPWPERFTKAPTKPLWRIMCLPQKTFNEIMAGSSYAVDHVSSWTLSEKIAREFIGSHWFTEYATALDRKGQKPVAFLMKMKPTGPVLNIDMIHKDPEFKDARDIFEEAGVFFNEGLDFADSQQEVAIPKYTISKNIIADYATLDMNAWKSGKKF